MEEKKKRDFDAAAASWDENPVRTALARDVAAAIARTVPLHAGMDALDFGCGTGLLALALRPLVGSVTGLDTSRGMLDVLEKKAAAAGIAGVRTVLADIERGNAVPGPYGLIASCMAFHHVADTATLVRRLADLLAPGGHLCVADLDPDGGLFHGDATGVFHNGFDREALARTFAAAGLADVRTADATSVTKPGADGATRTFTIFLVSGRRP